MKQDILILATQAFGDKAATLYMRELEKFAELVSADEREAIAKKFDGPVWSYDYREIAAAIRARGE
jgi:hypothetical protein